MATPRPRVIALEEHYTDPEVMALIGGNASNRATYPGYQPQLHTLEPEPVAARLRNMDETGIDVQVLAYGATAIQRTDPEKSVRLARLANDRLYESIQAYPDRFAAFAALPTPDPAAAAEELDRTVTQYGFKGAMVHGLTNGVFFDDKRFWPIFERAEVLDVPLYLHPGSPHPAVVQAYYQDYLAAFPNIAGSTWGFTVETATQGVRLVLSGVFDAYPGVQIILGHMGESLPFSLWRIDYTLARDPSRAIPFRDLFCEHFYITTSGHFSTPALLCSIQEMGIDRIMFSVDYPHNPNADGTTWMQDVPLSPEEKERILSGNAARLLRL